MEVSLDAEAVKERLRIGLGFPAVHLREFAFQFAGADAVLIGEILFGIEGVLFLHDFKKSGIALDDSIQDHLAVVFILVLLQEGETLAGCHGDSAVGGIQLSGQDLEEGGFAGAVGTDDPVAVPFRKFDGNVFKKCSFSETECNTICCDHAVPPNY